MVSITRGGMGPPVGSGVSLLPHVGQVDEHRLDAQMGKNLARISGMERFRVEVLMQGWQPKRSASAMDLSRMSLTRCSLSFISDRMVAEPGVTPRYCSISSGAAKDRREEPICLDRSFVRKGLSPSMRSR